MGGIQYFFALGWGKMALWPVQAAPVSHRRYCKPMKKLWQDSVLSKTNTRGSIAWVDAVKYVLQVLCQGLRIILHLTWITWQLGGVSCSEFWTLLFEGNHDFSVPKTQSPAKIKGNRSHSNDRIYSLCKSSCQWHHSGSDSAGLVECMSHGLSCSGLPEAKEKEEEQPDVWDPQC